MPNRPAIPSEIVRQILIESGHRCSVCGANCPLERAHIVPWHKSRTHEAKDLICLCASCHERADLEKWGEKTLREYKQRPWILRQYTDVNNVPRLTRQIELTINMELSQFDEENQRWLQYAIAAFLNIAPDNVRIASVEESNSIKVKVDVDLPKGVMAELFKDLNEQSLSNLLNSSGILSLKAKEGVLLKATAPNLYLILDGYVSLRIVDRGSKVENLLGWRGPGQICGEVMEIGTEPATIRTAELIIEASSEQCVLLEIPNHVLIEVANDAPYLYRNIAKLLMENMYQEQDHLRILQIIPIRGRIAQTIIKLHRDRGYDESGSRQVIKGNVFQSDIASYTGCQRETVNRVMSELKRNKIIDYFIGGKISILDLDKLESLATGYWK